MKQKNEFLKNIDLGGKVGELRMIPLSSIKPSQLNTFDTANYEDLMASIKAFGLVTPLTVCDANERDEYVLISGGRRYNALTALHKDDPENRKYIDIPCYIAAKDSSSNTEKKILIEMANLEVRDDFNKDQHTLAFLNLLIDYANESGESLDIVKALTENFSYSDRYGRFWKRIIESGTAKVKNLVGTEGLNAHTINKIAGKDSETQDKIADEIKEALINTESISDSKERKKIEKENKEKTAEILAKYNIETKDAKRKKKQDELQKEQETKIFIDKEDRFSIDDLNDDELEALYEEIGEAPKNVELNNKALNIMSESESTRIPFNKDNFMSWANRVKSNNLPTSEEWEIINMCKSIAEHFTIK